MSQIKTSSDLEQIFLTRWLQLAPDLPMPTTQYNPGVPGKKFKCDFCWPDYHLIVEIQGGVFNGGRHGRGAGISNDYQRHNLISIQGWRMLYFTPDVLKRDPAKCIAQVRAIIEQE